MSRSEDELFECFRSRRDPAALAAVFDRLAPELLAVSLHLSGRRADAEDLVQQTFLVAIERAASWDRTRGLFPWLVGILTNQRRLQMRRDGRAADPARLPERNADDPQRLAEQRELDGAVERAVAALGETYRPVLHLHLRHGFNAKEIGTALGRPAGSVRTQLVRGLEQLRRALPAGLGFAAVAVLGAGRGLAAVRAEVLAAGRLALGTTAAAGTILTATLGTMTTKKLLFAGAAMLLVLLPTWRFLASDLADQPTLPRPPAPAAVAESSAPEPDASDAGARTAAAPTARVPDADASPGSIKVRVAGVLAPPAQGEVQELTASAGDGTPLAGVVVELWPGHGQGPTFLAARRTALTDARGEVTFAGVAPGANTVHAITRPRNPLEPPDGVRHLDLQPGQALSTEFVVSTAQRLCGRVVDESGTPVAEAEVWVGRDITGTPARPEHLLRRCAVSAPDGTFAALIHDHEERVAARKPGFADSPALEARVFGSDDMEWLLVLPREHGELVGFARDAEGRPLAGLAVGVQQLGDPAFRRRADGAMESGRLPLLVQTDADGRFAADLAPARYHCRAVGPTGSMHVEGTVTGGATTTVQLRCGDVVAVRGRVVDPAGAPVSGLPVWIPVAGSSTATTRTLADGTFLFLDIPRQPFVVEAGRPGGTERARCEQPQPTGAIAECALVFAEPPPLRGRVVDDLDRGLAGLHVAARTGDKIVAGAVTANDGTFALHETPAGTLRVTAAYSPSPDSPAIAETAGEFGPDMVIVLRVPTPRGVVHGRLVSDDGTALAGVDVLFDADDRVGQLTTSAADGSFRLEELPAVRALLRIRTPGHRFVTHVVDLRNAEVADVGDVVMPREAGLRIRFLRPDGTPWTQASPVPWICVAERVLRARGEVDYEMADGEVVVRGLAPGHYTIRAPYGDQTVFGPIPVDLLVGAIAHLVVPVRIGRSVELLFPVLPPGPGHDTLHIEVRAADGTVALRETLTRPQGLGSRQPTLAHAFAAGNYSVVATTAGGVHYGAEFAVVAGEAGLQRVEAAARTTADQRR